MTRKTRGLAIVSILFITAGWGLAQSSQHEEHHGSKSQQQGMMMDECQECQMMEAQYGKMMSMMKAQDKELKSLVKKMKATSDEDQKIEVMEKLLSKMVENRTQIQEQMMGKMMPHMMEHMVEHMHMTQTSGTMLP